MRMKRFVLLTSVIAAMFLSQDIAHAQKQCAIVAHRGFWNCEEAGYAKNSIAALRCAQEHGFWGSEFDVNMTADSVLLVYHDGDIRGKKIEKHPYSEFADEVLKNGEKIPTIDEYLEQGKKYPETMLVYELKTHSSPEVEDLFIDLSIAKLKEHDLLYPDRVMFISFSIHICEVLAQKLPDFRVQFLGSSKSPDEVADLGISGVDYNHGVFKIHKKWYKKARKRGLSVNTWTVNNKKTMKKMFKMGVDMLTTDNPLEAREILTDKRRLEEL
jgi:glycerophosphoryl diester phosphodiesterase